MVISKRNVPSTCITPGKTGTHSGILGSTDTHLNPRPSTNISLWENRKISLEWSTTSWRAPILASFAGSTSIKSDHRSTLNLSPIWFRTGNTATAEKRSIFAIFGGLDEESSSRHRSAPSSWSSRKEATAFSSESQRNIECILKWDISFKMLELLSSSQSEIE